MSEIEGPGIDGDELLPITLDDDADERHVVTFYSFKGGVGRTMALANVAFRLANRHALRVIVVDWDLEAPGLHRFFGYRDAELGDKPGVVDFFLEWQERYERGAESPPEIRPWLLPARAPTPAYGSVSILTAGKLNKGYGGRLESLDWRAFYEANAGALAVETLRKQLIEAADIVLVDSRTGLTDAGGICTVQLPDGVVLMTAPNEQSLAGTERVARTIAGSNAKRAGRGRPRIWLSVSRIPLLEETDASHAWLEGHRGWFEQGIESKLWRREEHLHGLRSHAFPHRPRFALGENIVNDLSGTDPDDPLARAYDDFATLILEWSHDPPKGEAPAKKANKGRVEELQAIVDEAAEREDVASLAIALYKLGAALCNRGRYGEAIAHLERARGIQATTKSPDVLQTTLVLGRAWRDQGQPTIALKHYEQARLMSERLGAQDRGAWIALLRGIVHFEERHYQEAWADFSHSLDRSRAEQISALQLRALLWMGHLRRNQRRFEEAWRLYEGADTAVWSHSNRAAKLELLQSKAIVRRERGQLHEAELLCAEALKQSKTNPERSAALSTAALIKARQGRSAEAIELMKQAVGKLSSSRPSRARISLLVELAQLQAPADPPTASSLLDETLLLLARTGWAEGSGAKRYSRGVVSRVRATCHRKQSRPADAVRHALRALRFFRRLREERYEEALTLAELSQDYAANNQLEEASAARQEGLAILHELNETFDETELFGPPLPA